MRSLVDGAIEEALLASGERYDARRIDVTTELRSTTRLLTNDPLLRDALITIFRALPDRLAPGSALRIRTLDRAGGDIELIVAGKWLARPDRGHSDLMALALEGLQEICRARAGRVDVDADSEDAGLWRISFLIPSLRREPSWHPLRRS